MSIWGSIGEPLSIPDRDHHDGHRRAVDPNALSTVDVAHARMWNELVRLYVDEFGEHEATVYLTIPEAEALRALLQAAIEHIQKLR